MTLNVIYYQRITQHCYVYSVFVFVTAADCDLMLCAITNIAFIQNVVLIVAVLSPL